MGLLRFILALAVVITHSQPLFGMVSVGGLMAVQSFFIMSGFFMAMILNEKYTGEGSYGLFITNRFLRIFPAYWAVLVLSLLMMFLQRAFLGEGFRVDAYFNHFSLIEIKSKLYIIFTNIFIFGQDTIMFLKLTPHGTLAFTPNFRHAGAIFPPVFAFLFIPQAWALGIELMFYMIAPLLVKRGRTTILTLIAVSLALRFYVYSIGLDKDPWTYRFFPTELTFFLFGILSYGLYNKYKALMDSKALGRAFFIFVITMTLFYQLIPHATTVHNQSITQWAYYMILVAGLPAIFLYSKDNRLDKYLGELSYPIYISHIFILNATTYKLITGEHQYRLFLLSFTLVILISMGIVHLIVRPIEKYRQARVKNAIC